MPKKSPLHICFLCPCEWACVCVCVCVCGCLSRMWKWMDQVASAGQGAHILPRKQRMDHFVCRQRVKNSSQIIAVRQVTLFMRQHTSSTTSSCPSSGSASHTPYQLDILCHMQQTKPFLLFDVRFGGPKWRNEVEESWPWAFSSFFLASYRSKNWTENRSCISMTMVPI